MIVNTIEHIVGFAALVLFIYALSMIEGLLQQREDKR